MQIFELSFFSKCPLTVCVWADKNVGYDDDIHHTAHALKELMYFARLSVVVRTGENDSYTIGVEEKRSKRLCFKKISGYVRTRPETISPCCSAAYFSIHLLIVQFSAKCKTLF